MAVFPTPASPSIDGLLFVLRSGVVAAQKPFLTDFPIAFGIGSPTFRRVDRPTTTLSGLERVNRPSTSKTILCTVNQRAGIVPRESERSAKQPTRIHPSPDLISPRTSVPLLCFHSPS